MKNDRQPVTPSTSATTSKSKQHCQQVEGFFWQSRMLLRHCCRFGNIVAVFGNNVEATMSSFRQSRNKLNMSYLFQKVSRKTRSTLLPFLATKSNECCFDKVERYFDIVAGVDDAYNCLLKFTSNHGSIALGFKDSDDITFLTIRFLTSRTLWPLLLAIRPIWSVCSIPSTGFLFILWSNHIPKV